MAKNFPTTTVASELQKKVESRGQKNVKKKVKQHLHHYMLFGRVSRKNYPSSSKKKPPAYSVIRHDWNVK